MRTSILYRSIIAISLSAGLSMTSFAQKSKLPAKVKVDKPAFDTLQSPTLGGGNSKSFRPKDWLEIEVPFQLEGLNPKSKDGFADIMEVKWYIVVKGQDRKNYRIEKTVKHVNIPVGEEVVTSVYLSPNTLKRITGKDKAGKGDLEAIGGEIHYGGTMVGFFSHGLKKGWWKDEIKSVTTTTKFPLLNKDETPFKLFWHDRYAEIAKKD